MKKLFELLNGNKTYIVAGLVALGTFARAVNWITEEQFQAIVGFLSAIGLYTIRSAVKKLE